MGIDRHERERKPDKWQMSGPRVWMPLDVLQGSAYIGLSFSARALLMELVAQLRTGKDKQIANNGDLTTAKGYLESRGWSDPKTVRKAAAELEESGLAVKTRQGQRPNKSNLYALTWLPLNESPKLEINAKGYPFRAYLLKNPLPKLKSEGEKFPITQSHRGEFSLSKAKETNPDGEKIPLSEQNHDGLIGKKSPPSIYAISSGEIRP